MTVITMIIFLGGFPPSQECYRWIICVGIRFSVAKFDGNDVVSLSMPKTLDHHVSLRLFFLFTPLVDIPLWSDTALMD